MIKLSLEDIQRMQAFEAKQSITGRIFDFETVGDQIYINNYHDNPLRREVTIPDFVDGFNSNEESIYGSPFYKAKYIEKIICKPLNFYCNNLFSFMQLKKLDLSEFDTSKVKSMIEWFQSVHIEELILGGKFITENVNSMRGMFMNTTIDKLTGIEEGLNTLKCKNVNLMFYKANIGEIKLGDQFVLNERVETNKIFAFAETFRLDLGRSFEIGKNMYSGNSFMGCNIGSLIVYNNILQDEEYLEDEQFQDSKIERIFIRGRGVSKKCIEELHIRLPNTEIIRG